MSPFDRLMAHEKVCAERYENIIERIRRIENLGIKAIGFLIVLLIGIIGAFAAQYLTLVNISSKLG